MPPKRKKSVRQKQKQRQSQSQKVIVNVGKTTPRKRRTTGRGKLPPPSYQQNLFPPTIIQQQAPSLGNLETQISRLTSLIQPTQQPIQNLNTPLSTNVQASSVAPSEEDIRAYEALLRAGEEAEKRRPGPTASNFQPMPSKSDEKFAQSVQDQDDIQSLADFQLKQRQPVPDVPFAVVEKGGEVLPLSQGTPKPGRPFQDLSKLTQAEPIGPPIADANQTVNLAQGQKLPSDAKNFAEGFTKSSQFKTEVKGKSTKDFTPITEEQMRLLKQFQKRGSLTPEEEKTKKNLKELARKSGRTTPKKVPPPEPKTKKAVRSPPPGERSSDEDLFISDEGG